MVKKIIAFLASIMPNIIRLNLYRLIGYKIGKNVKVGLLSLMLCKNVNIEDDVKIGSMNVFKLNKLEIGKGSVIRSLNIFSGQKNLKLGKKTQIVGPYTFMNLAEDIEIGDYTGLGSHSIFYTHGVYLPYTQGHPRKFGKIILGKRIWAPSHVIFLPGAKIGDDSIITVGSVISKEFPENSLISGNPARVISKASNLKVKMDKKNLQKRMFEIIEDFSKSPLFKNCSVSKKIDYIILKNTSKYFIGIQKTKKVFDLENYKESVIFGKGIPQYKSKNVSTFDLEKRYAIIKGKLGQFFLKHLERYGEYFRII